LGVSSVKKVFRALRRRNVRALAATAILAGGGAIAVAVPAVSASAAAVPQCTTAHLFVWMGVPGDGTGPVHYGLELSNMSSATCTLKGYTLVTAVGPGGKQLGSPVARIPATSQVITLTQGATAHVNLEIDNAAGFNPATCKKVNAIGLRVSAPNSTASTIVRFPFAACSKNGPVFLFEGVVLAGAGVPNFNI
jgi:hypothetical protein